MDAPRKGPAADSLRGLMDPAHFSESHFGWKPYPYQREVLDAILVHGKRRIAWVAGRRVGKTSTIANAALQLALRKPGIHIANAAPTFRQASILSGRIREFLEASPFRDRVVGQKADELRLRMGRDERGKPRDSVLSTFSLSGAVRGGGADVLIVDESAQCRTEDVNEVLPFVLDRPEGVIIHISTVWAEDDHFTRALNDFAALPHGKVFRTLTRENPTVTPAALEELRNTMTEEEFLRECECNLTAPGGVFDRRAISACLRDYDVLTNADLAKLDKRRNHDYYVGVDWGKKQDRSVVAVVEHGAGERAKPARLVFLQVYEPDPTNPHHYTRVLDDVRRVAKQVGARRVVADEGEGGHQAEVLRRGLGAARVRPFRFTGKSRDMLVDNARFLIEKRAVELPMEPDEVRRAFANVRSAERGYEHTSRKTKDVFDAIALALLEVGDAGAPEGRPPMRLHAVDRTYGLMMGVDPNRKPTVWEDPRLAWITPEMRRYIRTE